MTTSKGWDFGLNIIHIFNISARTKPNDYLIEIENKFLMLSWLGNMHVSNEDQMSSTIKLLRCLSLIRIFYLCELEYVVHSK